MFGKVTKIFKVKEIRNRLLVIAGILIVFRFLASIPVPGVDPVGLQSLFEGNQLLGFLNIFSGGALSNLSIAMLGLGPYITATIIMQLLTMIFPSIKAMYHEEGEAGRKKFNRYSRMLTIPLAALQGFGFLKLLQSQQIVQATGFIDTTVNILTITAGSMILVWLGEIITEQKLGNGISILIFAGIVSALPSILTNAYVSYSPDQIPTYVAFIGLTLLVIGGIVVVNEGERKIPVSYAKRVRGNKVYGGASSYLPLRVNQAGVIPIIFAISILLFPQFFGQIVSAFSQDLGETITNFVTNLFNNQIFYGSIYFALVFLFTYFYISVTFDPNEIAKNLQRSGGFIPGIRPGEPTARFLKNVTSRLTLFGASFLGLIAILPTIVQFLTKTPALTIGGTAILIVVSVALESAKQLDSQLTIREYDSFR